MTPVPSASQEPNGLQILLPFPDPMLNPNKHVGWQAKNTPRKMARDAAYILACNMGVKLDREKYYRAVLIFCPPNARERDLDNLVAAMKSALDGLCRGLGIDDKRLKPVPDWGPQVDGGKVEVTLIEIVPWKE